jgi:hypothetical protein
MPQIIFEWHGKEYAFEEKGADWYWALGIIATAAVIASILFGNVLLALVIATGATALALQTAKSPNMHRFAITDRGIIIDDNLYPYENIHSFSVLEFIDETLPPALSIKTGRMLAPHLLIPIIDHDPLEVYDYVSNHLPDGEHTESLIDRVVTLLRL